MNAVKEFEIVNAALAMAGQDLIAAPSDGTDRQKVEFLLSTYVARLKLAMPAYQAIKDSRLIPDLVVQHLVAILDGKERLGLNLPRK
jgi:hypothetical protein